MELSLTQISTAIQYFV